MGFDDELDFLDDNSYLDILDNYDTHNNQDDDFYWLNVYGDKYIQE